LPARWPGGVLMHPHRGAIDHQVLVICFIGHVA
jgi:hypothetical protein